MRTGMCGAVVLVAVEAASAPRAAPQEFHHVQGGQIEGVFFLDEELGATAEDGGRIRYTQDGGNTWQFATVPPEVRGELRGIFFRLNEQQEVTGWCVGDDGVCLRSTNAGETWTWMNEGDPVLNNRTSPRPASLWSIFMINDDDGWCTGDDGAIAVTEDSGAHWDFPSTLPSGFATGGDPDDGYEIHWFDATHGMLSTDYGKVYTTADGGDTWDRVFVHEEASEGVCPPRESHNIELWDLAFDDPDDYTTGGWAGGGIGTSLGYAIRFEGGGATWSQTRCYDGDLQFHIDACGLSTVYGIEVLGADPDACFVGYESMVFAWEDGESNYDSCECSTDVAEECLTASPLWVQHNDTEVPTAPPLLGVARITADEACIVGRFGIIRRFQPGETTEFIDEGTVDLHRIMDGKFVDTNVGCVVLQGLLIKRTTNGGETWSQVYAPASPDDRFWLSVDWGGTNGQKLVAGGQDGALAYSTNSGVSWTAGAVGGSDYYAVAFVPGSDTVYAVGSGGTVIVSTSAGPAWTPVTKPSTTATLHGAAFANASTGYVVGKDGAAGVAYVTSNAGQNWTTVSFSGTAPSVLYDVATWDDGASAIAVGNGGLVYERSGGGNFVAITDFAPAPAPTVELFDVEVLYDDPDLDVIITGDKGLVLFRDANGDWSAPKSQTTDPLVRASFQSPDHGFILGHQFLVCEYD